MRHEEPVLLGRLLASSRLRTLSRAGQLQAQHQVVWQQCVGEALQACSHPARLREGTLTVEVNNTAAASQIRYLQRILLQQLAQHAVFADVKKLQVVVTAAQAAGKPGERRPPVPGKRPAKRLSQTASAHLSETAAHVTDEPLREALLRLARHREGQ